MVQYFTGFFWNGSKQAQTVTFVRPTHPDVTSNKAGTCPKYGIALIQKKAEKE